MDRAAPAAEHVPGPARAGVGVYRPPKAHLVIGLVCLAFFSLMTVAGVGLPLADPDGPFARRALVAAVFGGFWGGWTLLSLYLVAACRRTRVYTSDVAVRYLGVFRTRTVPIPAVRRAAWRGWPAGGSLVLHTPQGRLAVHFGSFAGGGELAAFFRAVLPAAVQQGYERFEALAVPASPAFRRRCERDQRVLLWLSPAVGTALVAYAVWDP